MPQALGTLGDDALQPQLGGVLEEQRTVTVGMIAELDRRARMISPSRMAALQESLPAASGPVPAMSRQGSDLAPVDEDQGAVAVVL
jgi:hypothetical protein